MVLFVLATEPIDSLFIDLCGEELLEKVHLRLTAEVGVEYIFLKPSANTYAFYVIKFRYKYVFPAEL